MCIFTVTVTVASMSGSWRNTLKYAIRKLAWSTVKKHPPL